MSFSMIIYYQILVSKFKKCVSLRYFPFLSIPQYTIKNLLAIMQDEWFILSDGVFYVVIEFHYYSLGS